MFRYAVKLPGQRTTINYALMLLTVDSLSNEFSPMSDMQTSRLGRWKIVGLAFLTSNANR